MARRIRLPWAIRTPIGQILKWAALTKETDRGCALMAAAYLGQELRCLIYSRLIADEATEKQLFDGEGALATFSSRIAVAFAMGLIPPAARRDPDLIRKIRNIFGHDAKPIDFAHPPVSSRCREMHYRYEPLSKSPRRFFENAVFAILALVHATAIESKRPEAPVDVKIDDELRRKHFEKVEAMLAQMLQDSNPPPRSGGSET
jgi:DNA-binding MltR family transcriptional regulator